MLDRANTDVVLLGAGLGKRLAPLTDRLPKVLVPVKGKPLLAHHLHALATAGFERVVLVVGRYSDTVREYVRDQADFGLRISYCHQGEARGTGDAVRCALGSVRSDPFLVIYGDVFVPSMVDVLLKIAVSPEPKIVGARVNDASEFGRIISVSREGGVYLDRIIEKDGRHVPGLANAGVYLLPRAIGVRLGRASLSERGEIELTEAVESEVRSGSTFRVVEIDEWVDVGNPERLDHAEQLGTG